MRKPWMSWTALMAVMVLAPGFLGAAPARAASDDARPWLGVYMQPVDDVLRDALGLSAGGVLVTRVVDGSPAAKAGLRRGDAIVMVGGKSIDSPEALSEVVSNGRAGQSMTVTFVRAGRQQAAPVTLAVRPSDMEDTPEIDSEQDTPVAPRAPRAPRAPSAPRAPTPPELGWVDELRGQMGTDLFMLPGGRGRLGVQVMNLSRDLAPYFGLTESRGALVTDVVEDSPAATAGLKAGDVITRVGGKSVDDTDDLVTALGDAEGKVDVEVMRKGVRRTFQPTLKASTQRFRSFSIPRPGRDGDRITIRRRIDETPRRIVIDRASPGDDDLREQLRQLKEELRQLKEELKK